MYRPPDSDEMAKLKAQAAGGADFAQLARDFSEGPKAGSGGEIGWIAKGQLDDRLTDAIFEDAGGRPVRDHRPARVTGCTCSRCSRRRRRRRTSDQLEPIKSSAFTQLVPRQEGRGDDHPRAARRAQRRRELGGRRGARRARRRGPAPLGARSGRRPPGPRGRDARPLRPSSLSRPALIVPAAVLRVDLSAASSPDGAAAETSLRSSRAVTATGADPLGLLRRLYPADHPVGRFGATEGLTSAS